MVLGQLDTLLCFSVFILLSKTMIIHMTVMYRLLMWVMTNQLCFQAKRVVHSKFNILYYSYLSFCGFALLIRIEMFICFYCYHSHLTYEQNED